MKKSFITLLLFVPLFPYPAVFAVETAPRISDREIVEGLSTLRGDVKELRASINGSVNELRTEIKRLDERFDVLQGMPGIFITVAISLMGIMGRILWTQQKRQPS